MTTHSITLVKDSIEYEIDTEVSYPAGRQAGVSVNFLSVTNLNDMKDVDVETFYNTLTDAEREKVEKEADELAYAYANTDWT